MKRCPEDLLHYLKHQGVDVLERTVRILNPNRPRPSEESEENEKVPVPKKGAGACAELKGWKPPAMIQQPHF